MKFIGILVVCSSLLLSACVGPKGADLHLVPNEFPAPKQSFDEANAELDVQSNQALQQREQLTKEPQ